MDDDVLAAIDCLAANGGSIEFSVKLPRRWFDVFFYRRRLRRLLAAVSGYHESQTGMPLVFRPAGGSRVIALPFRPEQ